MKAWIITRYDDVKRVAGLFGYLRVSGHTGVACAAHFFPGYLRCIKECPKNRGQVSSLIILLRLKKMGRTGWRRSAVAKSLPGCCRRRASTRFSASSTALTSAFIRRCIGSASKSSRPGMRLQPRTWRAPTRVSPAGSASVWPATVPAWPTSCLAWWSSRARAIACWSSPARAGRASCIPTAAAPISASTRSASSARWPSRAKRFPRTGASRK